MAFPSYVKIVEVSPRDGLQNETQKVPTAIKLELISRLAASGLSVIEATSFVSPQWVPQLADHEEVYRGIASYPTIRFPVLVPNKKGMLRAIELGVKEIAVFTTPSEAFSQHNTHCSVRESLLRIAEVIEIAKKNSLRIRAYISCVLGCPYEGEMSALKVAKMAQQLKAMGCDEISLGDTIGVGTPLKTKALLSEVLACIPLAELAVHFHDTFGQAIANIYVALECGVAVIDSSVAGLGGCPYAKGARGNVATEDVLYLLQGLGIETGVDMNKLVEAGRFIANHLQRQPNSKVNLAYQHACSSKDE